MDDYRTPRRVRRSQSQGSFLIGIGLVGILVVVSVTAYLLGRGDSQPPRDTRRDDRAAAVKKPPPNLVKKLDVAAPPKPHKLVAKRPVVVPRQPLANEKPRKQGQVELIKQVEPCVVRVDVERVYTNGERKDFLGSGFVLGEQRIIVTNHHVIDGARKARVTFNDKTVLEVDGFIAISPDSDLALLSVAVPKNRPFLNLGPKSPEKGESVLAFGSPKGFDFSVSDGIVSAHRDGPDVDEPAGTQWIQTTAPISKGNSGGPLVNVKGDVVGANTWGIKPALAQNLNFAVSASDIRNLVTRAGRAQPLASLPPAKPPAVAANPGGGPDDERRKRHLLAVLAQIDKERLLILRKEEQARATIADTAQKYKAAQAEYVALAKDASAILASYNAVNERGKRVEQQLAIEMNGVVRLQLQNELNNLAAELRGLKRQYDIRDAQATKVKRVAASLKSQGRAAQYALVKVKQEADALWDFWLKAADFSGMVYRGETDIAIEVLTQWAVRDRTNPYPLALRAMRYADLGRLDEATQDYNRVAQLDWGLSFRRITFAYIKLRQGQPKTALAELNLAAKQSPRNWFIYLLRGAARSDMHDYQRAFDDLKKAVKYGAEIPWTHRLLAEHYAACPTTGRRIADKAMEHATKALELDQGNHWSLLDTLAMAYAEAGNFDQAVAIQKKAIAAAPEGAKADCRSRLALYQNGKPIRLPSALRQ